MDATDDNGIRNPNQFTDRVSRRRFLGAAAAGLAAYSFFLPSLADAKKRRKKHKKAKLRPTATPTATPTVTPKPLTIRDVATARGIQVGVASGISGFSWPAWAATLAEHFNTGLISDVTMKNVDPRYPDFWPAPTTHNFGFVDTEVAFLSEHGLSIYWEPLLSGTVWVADWLKNGTFTPDEMRQIIQDHITVVMNRYKADIHHWNVVTEPVPQRWIGSDPFSQVLGDSYIDLAFQTARTLAPSAVLTFVDDSSATPTSGKYQWDLMTVQRLRNKTVTVDGTAYPLIDRMNVEFYYSTTNAPTPEELGAAVDGFKQLGVDVQVDITVAIDDGPGSWNDKLAKQAEVYGMAMDTYLQHGVKTFIIWGLHDGGSYPVGTHAALFDDNLQPKPAYYAVLKALGNVPTVAP